MHVPMNLWVPWPKAERLTVCTMAFAQSGARQAERLTLRTMASAEGGARQAEWLTVCTMASAEGGASPSTSTAAGSLTAADRCCCRMELRGAVTQGCRADIVRHSIT